MSPKVETDGSPKLLSLEEVSTPYVDTLTLLRKRHEENIGAAHEKIEPGVEGGNNGNALQNGVNDQSSYFMDTGVGRTGLSGKALEDQVSSFYCFV